MHRFWLVAALLVLPLAGVRAQALPPNCSGVLEVAGWQSKSERGYWASSVDLRNISGQPVQVTVSYSGTGAMNRPAFRMEPGGWARQWLARTSSFVPESMLRAATVVVCGTAN